MCPSAKTLTAPVDTTDKSTSAWRSLLHPTVIVAALGYMVDVYDMVLFSLVRHPSLEALGYHGDAVLEKGVLLINLQMLGMLCGGVFWGMLGDKKGRMSVLFGSILLYSLANLANAWVTNIHEYGALRFIAGFGLAGELGAAVTLVSEALKAEHRGLASAIIAAAGAIGSGVSSLVGEFLRWEDAYIFGGIMGLLLLALRLRSLDSDLFKTLQSSMPQVNRGDLRLLFNRKRAYRYALCVLTGGPVWFVSGVLIGFAPEIGRSLGVVGNLQVPAAIFVSTLGYLAGDLINSVLSQRLSSRKKVIVSSVFGCSVFSVWFSLNIDAHPWSYYALLFALGYSTGYWSLLMTSIAEQFGTNMRATVTTTVPNIVRALVIPMTLGLEVLRPEIGLKHAVEVVGGVVICLGAAAAMRLRETYGNSMDFVEA